MSYSQYLRTQAGDCVGLSIETPKCDEAAALLDLAEDYCRVATMNDPALAPEVEKQANRS